MHPTDLMRFIQLSMMVLVWLRSWGATSTSPTHLPSPCMVERFTGRTGGPTRWLKPTSGPEATSPWSREPTHNLLTCRSTTRPDSHRVGIHTLSPSTNTTKTTIHTLTGCTYFLLCFPVAPNPCAAKDGKEPCSHLCLINYNQTFSCSCPHLMKLSADKRTCLGESELTDMNAFLVETAGF